MIAVTAIILICGAFAYLDNKFSNIAEAISENKTGLAVLKSQMESVEKDVLRVEEKLDAKTTTKAKLPNLEKPNCHAKGRCGIYQIKGLR